LTKKNTSSKFRLLLTGQLVKSKNKRYSIWIDGQEVFKCTHSYLAFFTELFYPNRYTCLGYAIFGSKAFEGSSLFKMKTYNLLSKIISY